MSLRRRFSILIAVCLTPPLILTVFNTARSQLHLEDNVRSNAIADAQLASNELTQVIQNGQQLLTILSKSPAISTGASDCVNYFKDVIAGLPSYSGAAIIDRSGRFRCSTISIPADYNVSDQNYFSEPLASGKFTIGKFAVGRFTPASSIPLSMPYNSADGVLSGVIVVVLDPQRLAQTLAAPPRHAHERIIVLDHDGSVVLTVPQNDADEASNIAKAVFPMLTPALPQTVDTNVIPNNPKVVGYAPVNPGEPGAGLRVLVAIDRNNALAEGWHIAARSLAIGLGTILLAVGAAWIATHFIIIRPIRAVVRIARRREHGDTTARFPNLDRLSEFGQLNSSLARMSDKVDELLSQKALLLRELQHRVMNSLNLLTSIFDLQARQLQSTAVTRQQLARARDRVVALGSVYRYLYKSDAVDDIEIGGLLKAICHESENAYEGPVKKTIDLDAETLLLSGTNAIALAMLTHELIANSIKHAYATSLPGSITVSLKRINDSGFEFRFADQGRGLPEDFQIEKSDSLGMIMILATVRQLDGKLDINRLNPGTEFVLTLPPQIEQSKRPDD